MLSLKARLSLFLLFSFSFFCVNSFAYQGGVILLYHHVSDTTPEITSVSSSQFEAHLNYLETNNFEVVSTSQILNAARNGIDLPPKAVAINFDDAYESVYSTAFPALKVRDWPFSIFVSSDAIDGGYNDYMSWQQLAEVLEYGAEIGGHTASHAHLVRSFEDESYDQWLMRVSEEIDKGNRRIEEVLNIEVRLFAYPYGEFTQEIKTLLSERNLFGLAQYSGAVSSYTDLLEAPRYPMASSYADIERFALVAQTKALPVLSVEAGELIRIEGQETGELNLLLDQGDYRLSQIACYSATGQVLDINRDEYLLEINLPDFVAGRNKINCTAPSSSESGVYYWFSRQWIVKDAAGNWLAE